MKKQFHKIKIAAENLSRSNRSENKNDELGKVEKHVEKYKDVLEKIYKKFSPYAGSEQDKEKRIKKIHEYRLGQALEESSKDLPGDLILYQVLTRCGELEKTIASYIVENEIQTENEVTKKLKEILDKDVQDINSHKRTVSRYLQEYNSIKKAYENMQRSNENNVKLNQLKLDQEEWELKLEKERDCWAAQMFELIAKDEIIAYSIRDFVVAQKAFYEKALKNMEVFLNEINEIVQKCQKKRVFGVALKEHLNSTNREISFVIELCVCSLMERGLYEEGLLRVGCAGTKLRRMKNAIDAQYVAPPLAQEYQDIHVLGGLLKLYLRELPEPLLTYHLYTDFIKAAQRPTEHERKTEILNIINRLPKENYDNLRYLTRFLWCLYQKRDQNKMSSQNIAIVMSPNILWPPEGHTAPNDYVDQVNSSAAVNTIVELLVSEWDYFFSGHVDFFINFNRDTLFIENGGSGAGFGGYNSNTSDNSSQIIPSSEIYYQQQQQQHQQQQQQQQQHRKQSHSRSSSHDTSHILLNSLDTSSVGRSHSNDSLSENSSPTHGESPKLPARRKHNKPSAPIPPSSSSQKVTISTEQLNNMNSHRIDEETTPSVMITDATTVANQQQQQQQQQQQLSNNLVSQKCDGSSQTPPLTIVTDKNASKPEKPPRPQCIDSFTLNRTTYKNRSNERLQQTTPSKPIALPRTILNVARSTENLSTFGSDDIAQLREKPEIRGGKPAIPERPVTLMRPTSFRMDNSQNNDLLRQLEMTGPVTSATTTITTNGNGNSSGSSLKKASSFRMSAITSPAQQSTISNSNTFMANKPSGGNNSLTNSTGSLCSNNSTTLNNNNNKTTLERAQFYSVDKKQVAIIDVISSSSGAGAGATVIESPSSGAVITVTAAGTGTGTTVTTLSGNNPVSICSSSISLSSAVAPISITSAANPVENFNSPFADSAMSSSKEFITVESGNFPPPPQSLSQVPPSPRGFDPRIKRPQVPAPPPPTNHRKSDDSTHL